MGTLAVVVVSNSSSCSSGSTSGTCSNLRELLATSVILGMCAGRWGRNGSSRRRIISPTFGVDEIVR